jgi:hypothetical protein
MSTISSVVTSGVASIVTDSIQSAYTYAMNWYTERKIVQRYGPYLGPAVVIATGLSLTQVAQAVNVVKTIVKLVRGKPEDNPTVSAKQPVRFAPPASVPYVTKTAIAAAAAVPLLLSSMSTPPVPLPYGYSIPPMRLRLLGLRVAVFLIARQTIKVAASRLGSPLGSDWSTPFVNLTLAADILSSSQQRQVFVDTPLVVSPPVQNHTHGNSASSRNAGTATAVLFTHLIGKTPYMMQMSLADMRKSYAGDRTYHWPKDLSIPHRRFSFDPKTHVCILNDVDYYVDMPQLLARFPGTYILACFQPTTVAQSLGEYVFKFLEDNTVDYRVSGGAHYNHLVWNYTNDTIIVEDVGHIAKTVVGYHIDRKYVDQHHCIILLTVLGKFKMPSFAPTSWAIRGQPLERLHVVTNGHAVLDIMTSTGIQRSVAIANTHTAVTMPMDKFDAVLAVSDITKNILSAATVASNIQPASSNGMPIDRLPAGHAAIITSYMRSLKAPHPPVVYPPELALIPVHFGKHDYDAPVPLAPFGAPLIGPNYQYKNSIHNDGQCIEGRVEKFHKKTEEDMPPTLAALMVEFATHLIPESKKHTGVPVDRDEVRDRQPRPSQQNNLNTADVTGPWYKRAWDAFVKKEPAQKPSDPRNISQGHPASNANYAEFVYAFKAEVMAEQKWYAFNKTPLECAQRLVEILEGATHAVLADGSRFDGHVGLRSRILERIIFLRFFRPEYHSRLNEAMNEQIGLPGTTTEGRKYHSGYGRGSGSLETSENNTLNTAFMGYCGWRHTSVDGIRLNPDQAWARLGIYGGDDSAEGAIDPDALKRASILMGQEYEIEVIPRGMPGVNFLNRFFGPDVWFGDMNSMANPARLLAKLWVGPATLNDVISRLAERLSGYYRTDRNSPVIGEIVRRAHVILGERPNGILTSWDGKHPTGTNWPNEASDWMDQMFTTFIPDFNHYRFTTWINSCTSGKHFLQAPLCTDLPMVAPIVKVPCVVGEDLLKPEPKPDDKGKEELNSEPPCDPAPPDPAHTPDILAAALEQTSTTRQLLPTVDSTGKRVDPDKVEKTPLSSASDSVPNSRAEPVHPKDWIAPVKSTAESPGDFAKRLAAWHSKRTAVIKRIQARKTGYNRSETSGGSDPGWDSADSFTMKAEINHWFLCVVPNCYRCYLFATESHTAPVPIPAHVTSGECDCCIPIDVQDAWVNAGCPGGTTPDKRFDETIAGYTSRIRQWYADRIAESQINGNHGSWTNSDDTMACDRYPESTTEEHRARCFTCAQRMYAINNLRKNRRVPVSIAYTRLTRLAFFAVFVGIFSLEACGTPHPEIYFTTNISDRKFVGTPNSTAMPKQIKAKAQNQRARAPNARTSARRQAPRRGKPSVRTVVRSSVSPLSSFQNAYTSGEAALHDWMTTVMEPDTPNPARVPVLASTELLLDTEVAQIEYEGIAEVNSDGYCFVKVGADGWGNGMTGTQFDNLQYSTKSGGTQGRMIQYSTTTYAGTTISAGNTSPTGTVDVQNAVIDTSITDRTNVRMISTMLEVWTENSGNSEQGNVQVVSSIRPGRTVGAGSVDACTLAHLASTPPEIMSRTQISAKEAESKSLRTVCIPSNQQCLYADTLNSSTGYQRPVLSYIAAVLSGAQAGSKLHWRVIANYEFEWESSHIVSLSRQMMPPTQPAESHLNATKFMLPDATRTAKPETFGKEPAGYGSKVYLQTRPDLAQHATKILREQPKAAPSFFDKLPGLIGSGIKAIGNIPFIKKHPVLGTLAGLVSSIFDEGGL